MSGIFLGKPFHWLLLAALVAAGWWLGIERLHVREFNLFVIAVLAATVLVIVLVLKSSAPGEQVTRDPVEPADEP